MKKTNTRVRRNGGKNAAIPQARKTRNSAKGSAPAATRPAPAADSVTSSSSDAIALFSERFGKCRAAQSPEIAPDVAGALAFQSALLAHLEATSDKEEPAQAGLLSHLRGVAKRIGDKLKAAGLPGQRGRPAEKAIIQLHYLREHDERAYLHMVAMIEAVFDLLLERARRDAPRSNP